ncbi:MAG: phosphoribosylglycinamide formyltransferase-1 [Marivirga sp.]|jgi:phosphoribosylglycinamide formyltransferase-1
MKKGPYNIAILASGSGSNAEKIAYYFSGNQLVNCRLLVSNKAAAGVFERFKKYPHIKAFYLSNKTIREDNELLHLLKTHEIDYIILAGFLLKIPSTIVDAFPQKILNIHPALLPRYGGKGMYGHFVHEAVIKNKEKESGITIHQVNEAYDEGTIIFQAECLINMGMTAEQLAAKVQQLEHQHYPKVIEQYILDRIRD